MTRHSSYSAPRSERSSGPQAGQRGRSSKRNTYSKRSWKDNRVLFILVCFILPFIVINLIIVFLAVSTPRIEYNISDTTDYKTVELNIKIHSLLPLRKMSVTLESQPINMVKEKGVYTTTLTENGTLEILVTGWNGMTTRAYEHVATLDDAPPSIDQDNYVMENGHLTVTASDSQSGVNYDAAYGVDQNGTTIKPTNINKETGEITFPMDTDSLTVYIEDFAGNTFKASFTNRTVGIDTGNRNTQFPSDGKNGTNGNSTTAKGGSDAKKTTTDKAKETTKAAKSTDKTKETTKAAKSTDKTKETTKADKSTDKAKETTKSADKTKETTKAKESTVAKESSKASAEASKPAESTAPVTAPSVPMAPGGGDGGAPTQAPPQTSQPGAPGGGSNNVTVVPLS